MTTFTSTLPDDLLQMLHQRASQLSIPKNRLIEKALRIYLDQLNKAEYRHSYRQAATDADTLSMAEEGMIEYFNQLPDESV